MCSNSRVQLVVPRLSEALPVGLVRCVLLMLVLSRCGPFIPAIWRRASDLRPKVLRETRTFCGRRGWTHARAILCLAPKLVPWSTTLRLVSVHWLVAPPIQASTVPKSSFPVGRDKADIFRAGLATRIGAERVLGGRPRLLKDYLAYSR